MRIAYVASLTLAASAVHAAAVADIRDEVGVSIPRSDIFASENALEKRKGGGGKGGGGGGSE